MQKIEVNVDQAQLTLDKGAQAVKDAFGGEPVVPGVCHAAGILPLELRIGRFHGAYASFFGST